MTMARKTSTSKAMQAYMAKAKKYDKQIELEYAMACQTNPERGDYWNQSDFHKHFSRYDWNAPNGASKICHIEDHNGNDFKCIVVKRHLKNGWIDRGNQMIQEIEAWQKLSRTSDSDYLCPILKYFTSKSDKVTEESEKMQDNVVIIAIKAIDISNAQNACRYAEQRNRAEGYHGTPANKRYKELQELAKKMHWWDVLNNGRNSGVIFDYSQNCYKAVFIDYAL